MNHLHELLPLLRLQNTPVESAAPNFQPQTKQNQACQLGLLIQTRSSLYIVEIKRRKEIGSEIIDEILEKMPPPEIRPKNLSLRTALIYEENLAESVQETDFFNFIVPIEQLIEWERNNVVLSHIC